MNKTAELCQTWLQAKQAETMAVETRRQIEDELVKWLAIDEATEGTTNVDIDRFHVKVVSRLNRKVDAERVQEIAAEHGLTEHLSALFRWKPEINMTAWKSSDQAITRPLLDAITTTAGRPSFSISTEE
jgi:hypothetical protein